MLHLWRCAYPPLTCAVVLVGCIGTLPGGGSGGRRGASGSALVMTRVELDGQTGPLVDALSLRFPGMVVYAESGCPALKLRTTNTAPGVTEPLIYIDGTRALDTCVLSSTSAMDVDLVEIYPTGVTSRSGYATSAHGLVLVFLRK